MEVFLVLPPLTLPAEGYSAGMIGRRMCEG